MTNSPALKDAHHAYQALLNQSRSLILATVSPDGRPLASYAPFIVDDRRQFYILISQLAAHTANLRQTGQASIMLIEDEGVAAQIFARRRVTFQCQATLVARDSAEGEAVLTDYEARFGRMAGLLKSLPDFQLFRLAPQSGSLVLGFGQVYQINGERFDDLTQRRNG